MKESGSDALKKTRKIGELIRSRTLAHSYSLTLTHPMLSTKNGKNYRRRERNRLKRTGTGAGGFVGGAGVGAGVGESSSRPRGTCRVVLVGVNDVRASSQLLDSAVVSWSDGKLSKVPYSSLRPQPETKDVDQYAARDPPRTTVLGPVSMHLLRALLTSDRSDDIMAEVRSGKMTQERAREIVEYLEDSGTGTVPLSEDMDKFCSIVEKLPPPQVSLVE